EESLEARDRLETPALKDLVYRLGTLPALPGTFAAINRLAESPAATVDDFVRALEADPAVCGNVLRAVNSAWFGLSRRVSTLKEAIALLGVRPLRSLVLTTELFGASGTFVERLRQRALERVAAMPKLTARAHATHLQDEATTAAVLADVGQLLFSLRIPEESTALYADPLATGRDRSEAERRLFGADHATVGAVLLRLWNLPPALVDAVALHHQPRTTPTADLGALVALAVKLQELGWARPEAARTLREEAGELAAAFGVSDLDGLRAACFPG
ncbi:MAG: HDOD domain-containing protein, partial [Myxococcota bacterium]